MLNSAKLLCTAVVVALIAAAFQPISADVILTGDYVDNSAQGGDLTIGNIADGAMAITDDGPTAPSTMTNENGLLGYSPGAHGSVTVDGDAAKWTNTGDLTVGHFEASGSVTITNGGEVSNVTGHVGGYAGAYGTMTVDGAGSKWTNTGDATVGWGRGIGHAITSVLDIKNGGLADVGGTLAVNNTGQVKVDWAELHVGGLEVFGDMSIGSHGTLVLKDDAVAEVAPGMSLVVLGQMDMGSGALIMLTDDEWSDAGKLSHYMQQLDIQDAGIKGVGEVFVGSAGLSLGVAGHEGSLKGTSDTERLTVYGDVSGWGNMINVTLFGNLFVGSSPGIIDAAGLTLTSSGTLTMELGGLIAGSQFDQIHVNGVLELAGDLDVVWYDAFEAAMGDSFTLFDLSDPSAVMTGTFDTVNLPTFSDASLSWDTSNLYTTGQIAAVPEPATLLVLLAGGLPALLKRRSRRS